MYFKNIAVRAQGPVVGKKNSLNIKSMPQTSMHGVTCPSHPSAYCSTQRPTPALAKQNPSSERMSLKPFRPACPSEFSFLFFSSLFFHCHLLSIWIWFPVWFALGSCPLERAPWVSRGSSACFPFFSGEAGLTQLLWQPSFPRRAAKHLEPPQRKLGQHLLTEKPFQWVPSEPPNRAKAAPRVTHQPEALRKQSPVAPSTAPFENSYPTTCSRPTMHS